MTPLCPYILISIAIHLSPLAMDGCSLYMCVDGWMGVITLPDMRAYKPRLLSYGLTLFSIQLNRLWGFK